MQRLFESMALSYKTTLSAGSVIRDVLINDTDVKALANKIYPIVTDKAELPYILYRRAGLEQTVTKSGYTGVDAIRMEVNCYSAKYADSVELAECVRKALENADTLRVCYLSDCEETFEDDAFVQSMIFTIKL